MMKKTCFLLSVALLLSLLSTSAAAIDFYYTVLEDGTASITGFDGEDEYVEIPATLDGITVTSIDEDFWISDRVKTLAIPDTVTQIHSVFMSVNVGNGMSLSRILVSETHPTLASIDGVLFHKQDKRLIWYPKSRSGASYAIPDGIQAIGYAAFADNQFLADISIPDSVTSIEAFAFLYCSGLSSITLPEGITSIGESAFDSCTSLASITIPESITSIADSAFGGCSSLASVTLPEGLTSIGSYAFVYCSSLASITIPEGVTSIGKGAFRCCTSLTSITLPGSVTSIGDKAFDLCENLTITAPEGSFAYRYALEHGIPCTNAEYPAAEYRETTSTDWLLP